MNIDEALLECVIGHKVRAVDMPEGVYLDYPDFKGFRINFPSGDSSGWHMRDHDASVEWELYQEPKPAPGWDMSAVRQPNAIVREMMAEKPHFEPKRRGRKAWVPPAEVNDIDDAKPQLGEIPMPVDDKRNWGAVEVPVKVVNPWAEAGLTKEVKDAVESIKQQSEGWAIFNKEPGK